MNLHHNEKGNVMMMSLFTLLLVIVFSFIMFQFFGIYIVRRQAQNLTDSAALAAVQELRNKYEDRMEQEANDAVNEFWEQVEEYQDSFEDPPSDEEVVRAWITNTDLENQLLGYTALDWVAVVNESWFVSRFFGPERNGTYLYEECIDHSSAIRNVAKSLIQKNKGKDDDFVVTFPAEGEPKLLVLAKKSITITSNVWFKFSSTNDVPAKSAAGIDAPFEVDVSNKVAVVLN